MKSKQNKLPNSIDQKYEKQVFIDPENRKQQNYVYTILQDKSSILQRDGEILKIQEELHNRLMYQKRDHNQPLRYAQFVIRQRQSELKIQSPEIVRLIKKEDNHDSDVLKVDTTLITNQDFEHDKLPLVEPRKQNSKKKLSMKYRDIVKSILRKSVAKSFHDESLHVISYQSKPKSISQHEQSNSSLKPIDKYILSKLENIVAQESQELHQQPNHSLHEMITKNSLVKLIPITTATAALTKYKKQHCSDNFPRSKHIQEFQVDPRNKNYEITRKAQERMLLYQKFLKTQHYARSRSVSLRPVQ